MHDFLTTREVREIAEPLFWWAGVALPIVTVGAILLARAQLVVIANQAQATLLLDLVDKWNSTKMYESRVAFNEVDLTAKNYIDTKHAGMPDKEIKKKLKEHFVVVMADLVETNNRKYSIMLEMMSFFEIVGLLVKRKYVRLSDIDGHFRGTILAIGVAYVLHINDEQRKKRYPPGYYEHALFLILEIEKICP